MTSDPVDNAAEKNSFTPPDVRWLADAIIDTLTTWTINDVPVVQESRDMVWHLALGLAYQSREYWKRRDDDNEILLAALEDEDETRAYWDDHD